MTKMENYNILYLLKAENVKRWHTVPTVRSQSLAEHQWNVSMIAESLALSMGLDDLHINAIVRYALVHDIDEITTGDIPTPAKELETNGRPIETRSTRSSGEGAGDRPAYRGAHPVPPRDVSDVMASVVRAADLIDAWRWYKIWGLDPKVEVDCKNRLMVFLESHPAIDQWAKLVGLAP